MARWVQVATTAECPPGTSLEIVAEDRIVALSNVDGQWHALDGVCPHQGGPLGQGVLSGSTLTCPWHGWQFDVRTGKNCLAESIVHPRFDVKIEEEQIFVDLET